MKLIAPDYYLEFNCIADKCKHNCCIGWEIDIDDSTYKYYQTLTGKFEEKIKKSISTYGTPHFILDKNERCPFLNDNNLCDIIAELGHDKLCQICSDHPRFRNFLSDRTEIGLGFCCEEAVHIALNKKDKTRLVQLNDYDEQLTKFEINFLNFRNNLFDIIQNRNMSIDKRIELMLNVCNARIPKKTIAEWANIYLSLERLDPKWTDMLINISTKENDLNLNIEFEQFLFYLIYRHLTDAINYGDISKRASFIAVSYLLIKQLCITYNVEESVRMYCSEIEYSENNLYSLIDMM